MNEGRFKAGQPARNPVVECSNGCGYEDHSHRVARHRKTCVRDMAQFRALTGNLPDDVCWESPVHIQGKRAYVVAAELAAGHPVPPGFQVNHRECDNRRCCNPAHVYMGTSKENMRDLSERGRPGGRFEKGNYPARWKKGTN